MTTTIFRAAVIGGGPSGIFCAADLLKELPESTVDIIDRDPTPYGLLRHGVAPDHLKIKSLAKAFARVLADERVTFLGNVEVGRDLDLADIRSHYDIIVFATGATGTRTLDIPGEDLPGSISARQLVNWYNAHSDASESAPIPTPTRSVVVIGAGNVALDVSRVLLTGGQGLEHTDVPRYALDGLDDCATEEVTIVIRRGPAHVKFTLPELLEFDDMDDVEVIVDPRDLRLSFDDLDRAKIPQVAQILDLFDKWTSPSQTPGRKRLRFRFWTTPVEVLGSTAVEAVRLSKENHDDLLDLPAAALISAVGFRGTALDGLPHDDITGAIRNHAGRVTGLPRTYVAGWAKRGPNGVIGTNKACARETVDAIVEDVRSGVIDAGRTGRVGLESKLAGLQVVLKDHWRNIDEAEIATGRAEGRDRAKLGSRANLLREAHSSLASAGRP